MTEQRVALTPNPKPLLTAVEFHEQFKGNLGINAIRRLVKEGRIRSIAAGDRKRLIPASELTNWPQREMEREA